MIDRILHVWSRVETLLIGILLIIALVVFLGGGLLRVVAPAHAVDWATEVAIYFIIWATVLAGAAIVQDHRHLSTEVFVSVLPPRIRYWLGWMISILSILFIAVMLVYGWQAYEFSTMLDERSGSSLRAPQGLAVFLPLPIGMALILLRCALMLLRGQQPFGHLTETPERGE